MPVVTSAYKLYNDYITANSEAEHSGQVQVLVGEDRGLCSGHYSLAYTVLCISMDSLLLCTCTVYAIITDFNINNYYYYNHYCKW